MAGTGPGTDEFSDGLPPRGGRHNHRTPPGLLPLGRRSGSG